MILENVNALIFTDMANTWSRTVGAYKIATELRKSGYSCQIIDATSSFTEEQIRTILSKTVGPDTLIIGIASTFVPGPNGDIYDRWGIPFSAEAATKHFAFAKSINPKIKILLGGYKSQYPNPAVDARLVGNGDVAITQYMDYLRGSNPFFQFKIDELGKMVIDGDNYNGNFNFQDSQIVYAPEDNVLNGETLVIETARGCIFKCKFCSWKLNGKTKNDYIKHPHVLREELMRNYEQYGITRYYVADDTFNDTCDKLKGFAEMADTLPFKLELDVYLRIDLIRKFPIQYDYLRRIGLHTARFGIETLNYESAKLIGKGLHPSKVIEELNRFKKELPHVKTVGAFIIGLPLETKDTLVEWTDKLRDPNFPLSIYRFNPLAVSVYGAKQDKSIFEQEAEKYFKFNDVGNWYTEHLTREWCVEFALRITEEMYSKCLGISGETADERSLNLIKKYLNSDSPHSSIEQKFIEASKINKTLYLEKVLTEE